MIRRHSHMRVVATLTGVALCAVGAWRCRTPATSTPRELADLVAAVGASRPIEPRLTGGFGYGPLPTVRSDTPARPSPDVTIAAAKIDRAAMENGSPRNVAALGIAHLVTGNPLGALSALERSARDWPADATVWSNLAAAHLVLAASGGTKSLARAIDAADRATRLAPTLAEAWFNRALAVERIGGLRREATRTWEAYLRIDDRSAWSAEARQHLQNLSADPPPKWDDVKDAVHRAAANNRSDEVVAAARRFPRQLRDDLLGQVIPAWLDAQLAKDARAAELETVGRSLAQALLQGTGDPMAHDVLAHVDGIRRRSVQNGEALARAISAFGRAKDLFDSDRVQASLEPFETAASTLEGMGSPLAAEAKAFVAAAFFYAGRYDDADRVLTPIIAFATKHGYDHLAARAHWIAGLMRELQVDLVAAQTHFEAALAGFERLAERENECLLHNLLAENFRLLGQSNQSWEHHARALELVGALTRVRESSPVLNSAAETCLREQLPGTAAALHNELVALTRAAGDSRFVATAYVRRARDWAQLGDMARADQDLHAARLARTQIKDASLARAYAAEGSAAEGEIWQNAQPDRAVRAITDSIGSFQRTNSLSRLPALYLTRGRAFETLGEYDRAAADYQSGIEIFEQEHRSVRLERLRTSHYDRGWELFTQMVAVEALRRNRADSALAFAERARARTLLEAVASATTARMAPEFDVAAVAARLPEHVTVVSYLTLSEQLLAWVFTRHGAALTKIPVTAPQLATMVEAQRASIERSPAAVDAATASARLYDMVVRPVLTGVPRGSTLVFVTDGPLHAVAFAALLDAGSGRFLIEDYRIGETPSLALFVQARADGSAARPLRKALIVSNPAFDRVSNPGILDLPEATAEAKEIARLYAEPTLRDGTAATKRDFFERIIDADVVHFAGHAIQNPEFPWLSRLVFAADPGRADSGVLFAHELTNTRLSAVQLVILAACRTADGPAVRGEGVLSLARPFMAAGVATVVGTLWDVSDRATRPLLVAFHRAIAQGRAPVDALQEAQLSMLTSRDPALRMPASWAGFVVIGNLSQTGRNH